MVPAPESTANSPIPALSGTSVNKGHRIVSGEGINGSKELICVFIALLFEPVKL